MNTAEQQHLTGLVEKAFRNIGHYNTIGYRSGYLDAETMAALPPGELAKSAEFQPRFDSFLGHVAKEELQRYVLSPQFKESAHLAYYREDLADGKQVPALTFDGSVEDFDIDVAPEVRNYLIQVSKLSQLYGEKEGFQQWFNRTFLAELMLLGDEFYDGHLANEYFRRPCQELLKSRDRQISFDDALGFELGAFDHPNYLKEKALKRLHNYLREGKIQNTALHEEVIGKIKGSDRYALLFADPIILFSTYQALVRKEGSLAAERLRRFLRGVKGRGVIPSFAVNTPYPMSDPTEIEKSKESITGEDMLACAQEMERYAFLQRQFNFTPKVLKYHGDFHEDEKSTHEERQEAAENYEASDAPSRFTRTPQEVELFSRKVLNHLAGLDPNAYAFYARMGFRHADYWPAVMEEIANTPELQELFTDSLFFGSRRKSSPEQPSFYTAGQFTRNFTAGGENYTLKIERNLVAITNALCDREKGLDSERGLFHEGLGDVIRFMNDPQRQFLSVYQKQGPKEEIVGTVMLTLDAKRRELDTDQFDAFTGKNEKMGPLQEVLQGFLEGFRKESGLVKVNYPPEHLQPREE